ncbi:hypothetical protein K439DRAFT_815983 [Ramaria rubella]|nr:hypothetical protein K439DRAFT_815983 [Ramaria rubella]
MRGAVGCELVRVLVLPRLVSDSLVLLHHEPRAPRLTRTDRTSKPRRRTPLTRTHARTSPNTPAQPYPKSQTLHSKRPLRTDPY